MPETGRPVHACRAWPRGSSVSPEPAFSVHDTRILIGPFSRRSFADGLLALLRDEAGYSTVELATEDDVRRHLDADEPTVLILEAVAVEQSPIVPSSPSTKLPLRSWPAAAPSCGCARRRSPTSPRKRSPMQRSTTLCGLGCKPPR